MPTATWRHGAPGPARSTATATARRRAALSAFYTSEDIAAGKPDRQLARAAADGRIEDEGWRVRRDGSRFYANVVITALYDRHRRLRGFAKSRGTSPSAASTMTG